ncbi:MAG: DUF3344 domain-containing protein [Methanosarcinaceae archaeon]|nr:DUF3344 domain-containing protein [Methanosarcinaceae archaeon]
MADSDFEGVPYEDKLNETTSGSIKGSVFIDGGHGIGSSPYTQSFSVPEGEIIFSKLYVGIWGGNEEKTGTLQTTFNDHEFDTLELEGEGDTNPEVYCAGHGVYWVAYNTREYTTSGSNTAVARTSGDFDGRVYGIVLVAVCKDEDGEQVEYWINDGNLNLHGVSGDIPDENNEAYAYFSGIDTEASAARLTVAYLCGSPYENDYLYFNDNKLNGDDVASSTGYFDLLTFDVTDFLEESSEAKFDRGDEDYIHPVLAVLTVYSGEMKEDSDLIIQQVSIPELYTDVENTITAHIANIGTGPAFGFSAALYSDGEIVSKAQVSSVNNGQNRSVDFIWTPKSAGRHVLKVMADYTDIVSELRENNNNNTPFTVDILDRTPPNITISSPLYDQIFTSSNTVTVGGTIEESSRNTTMLVNGAEALLAGNKWSASVVLEQGMNWIIVDAIDESNNTATEFVIVHCDYDEVMSFTPGRSTRLSINNSNDSTAAANSSANSVFGGSGTFLSILFAALVLISIIVVGIRRRE